MKKTFIVIALGLFGFAPLQAKDTKTAPRKLTSYVNPMIGTSGMGHTFP